MKEPGLGGDTLRTTYPQSDVHGATETRIADIREKSAAHLVLRHQNEDGTTLEKINGALATTTPTANPLSQDLALYHPQLLHHPSNAPRPLSPLKKPPTIKNPPPPP